MFMASQTDENWHRKHCNNVQCQTKQVKTYVRKCITVFGIHGGSLRSLQERTSDSQWKSTLSVSVDSLYGVFYLPFLLIHCYFHYPTENFDRKDSKQLLIGGETRTLPRSHSTALL